MEIRRKSREDTDHLLKKYPACSAVRHASPRSRATPLCGRPHARSSKKMNPDPLIFGRRRPRLPLGETDEERSVRQAVKNAASRARYYLNKRKEEDERDARVRDALPSPPNDSAPKPVNASAAPVSNYFTGLRLGASLGFPNYARLSRDHDGSNWSLRQWRPLNEAHLKANPMLATH
eukprot:3061522-Pleurochrysis_carterae.AAC.2